MLVQLGAQVAGDPLTEHRHQPQAHQRRRLAYEVHGRHRRHGEPGDSAGAAERQPAFLRRPHHAVDQVAREVRRHQAHERDNRRGPHAEHQLPPVRREVAEQAADHRHLTARHQRLRVADRPRHAGRVLLVGVRGRDRAPRERLFEHELEVLEGAPLAVAVAQHGERGISRPAQQRQRGGGQSRRLAHRFDAGPLDVVDLPPRRGTMRHGDAAVAQGHPHLRQPVGVVEVGEGVELHRGAVPAGLDVAAQLRRQPGRLAGVARDDCVIRVVVLRIHARDPVQVWLNKTAPRVSRSTRKAGSRRFDPNDF